MLQINTINKVIKCGQETRIATHAPRSSASPRLL